MVRACVAGRAVGVGDADGCRVTALAGGTGVTSGRQRSSLGRAELAKCARDTAVGGVLRFRALRSSAVPPGGARGALRLPRGGTEPPGLAVDAHGLLGAALIRSRETR